MKKRILLLLAIVLMTLLMVMTTASATQRASPEMPVSLSTISTVTMNPLGVHLPMVTGVVAIKTNTVIASANVGSVEVKEAAAIAETSLYSVSNISPIERMDMVNTRTVALYGGSVQKLSVSSLSAMVNNQTHLRTDLGHLRV